MNIQNRKARFNYEIIETLEAGIVLQGNEVKSIRNGKANIGEAFITIRDQQAILHNMYIEPYSHSGNLAAEPTRTRVLLLNKREIKRLIGKSKEKKLTIIPLKLYFKKQLVKLSIGLGKGKTTIDKRDAIKKRALDREMHRVIKNAK